MEIPSHHNPKRISAFFYGSFIRKDIAKVVVMVYTERPRGPHVISLRKAEKYEARYYRQVAKENLG